MPTKAKLTRSRAPAAKARTTRKSTLEVSLDALSSQLSELGRRVTILEERAPIPGPVGIPSPQGLAGPKGDVDAPADMTRLEELERRIAALETRLAMLMGDTLAHN